MAHRLDYPLATPSRDGSCRRAALHIPPPDPAATSASSSSPCPSPMAVAVAEALPPGPAPPWQSCSQEGRSSATLLRLDRLTDPPRTPPPLPLPLPLGSVAHTPPELRCRVRCREEGSAAGDAAAVGTAAAASEAPASAPSGAKLAAELRRRTRRAVDWGACGCAPARPPSLAPALPAPDSAALPAPDSAALPVRRRHCQQCCRRCWAQGPPPTCQWARRRARGPAFTHMSAHAAAGACGADHSVWQCQSGTRGHIVNVTLKGWLFVSAAYR